MAQSLPPEPPASSAEQYSPPSSDFAADRRSVAEALRAIRPAVARYEGWLAFREKHVRECRRCRAAYNGDFLCETGEDLRRCELKALRCAGDRARDAYWAILFRDLHAGLYDDDPLMVYLCNGAEGEAAERRARAFEVLTGFLGTVAEGLAGTMGREGAA